MRPGDYCRPSTFLLLFVVAPAASLAAEPTTGTQTEKRFPPLQLPTGFRATLFACDPLVEYPSVIAPGFRNGTLLVAIDYMTGLGTEIIKRDEIRLLEDTDGDGYADKATVYATGFNSIQGLAQHDGTVYVMHSPYLTALRDTKGTGKADERRDLITGLGLAPEVDQIRLHNANGVVVGHDGWLYLALGDHGCNVLRPEGDRLILEGGGILRCRPDGRDLHVFARGLRNIYDVALDSDLNVFVRDNENDGGTYKVRLCHSFFGADHGYPYLYEERPAEALPPLADLGLGAPAGGVFYLETQFPPEYRGQPLFCEWGRAVVRSPLKKASSTFTALKESDFAAGAGNDPYGFKPTDLVVDRDGSLFISDWCDGQRPQRGRGRIYQVRYVGKDADKQLLDPNDNDKLATEKLVAQLDSPSYWIRRTAQDVLERRGKDGGVAVLAALQAQKLGVLARQHAIWVMAKSGRSDTLDVLFALAEKDKDTSVQAQALRAIADLSDPVLITHRLDARDGDGAIAQRIAKLIGNDRCDLRVQLEGIVALGRLCWMQAPGFLHQTLKDPDPALAHAAQWSMRQSANWPVLLKLLDEPKSDAIRAIALRAVAGQFDEQIADGLIARLRDEPGSSRRLDYADLLTRIHRKPGTWAYWGFRPAPRPANTVAWRLTEKIAAVLDDALPTLDSSERIALLHRMVREHVSTRASTLAKLIEKEHASDVVSVLLAAANGVSPEQSLLLFEAVLRDAKHSIGNRLTATTAFVKVLKTTDESRLVAAAEAIEDGPVLTELLRAIGTRHVQPAIKLLVGKSSSKNTEVRVSAITALAELGGTQAVKIVESSLSDADTRIQTAAALAAGKLGSKSVSDHLLTLTASSSPEVRSACLIALRQLDDRRAIDIAIAVLDNRDTAQPGLDYLAKLGGPAQATPIAESARRDPSLERLSGVARVFGDWLRQDNWSQAERVRLRQATAQLQGHSGMLIIWRTYGPDNADAADQLVQRIVGTSPTDELPGKWRVAVSSGAESRLRLGPAKNATDIWVAIAEIEVPAETPIELFSASTGLESVWLNNTKVFQRERHSLVGTSPDRVATNFIKGANRIVVRLSEPRATAEFQLRFRRKSTVPLQERYAAAALSRAGNPVKGKEIFFNADKSQCIKCHRVGDQGERFGPELTGLGSRFSRAFIIESILEPSRAIAPSFATTVVDMKNERSISGLKIEETDSSLVLIDSQAKKHTLAKSDIESRRQSALSTMPDGFEKTLKEDEFVDLIAFLASLKADSGK